MNPGAEHLKDEVHRALDLLGSLTKPNPPQSPLGELNPKAIKHCRVCIFLVIDSFILTSQLFRKADLSIRARAILFTMCNVM